MFLKKVQLILSLSIACLCSCNNKSHEKSELSAKVKNELSSDFFQELYSNTYYDLVKRIEPDGYLEESKTGQYGGMYLRTVGAIVPLLIETGELEHAEHLINCAFDAMKTNGLERIPHVTGRKLFPNQAADSLSNPYQIVGTTDQIDGQAHVIMAWALLALHRGKTDFENRTWRIASDLMTRSTQPPYLGLKEKGTISNLIHNYNFEHSRPVSSNYNLLTQCFIGSALENMISVAKRRNETELVNLWTKRIETLRAGIQQHMIRNVNGKDVYYELLAKEGNTNNPFYGMGWVNLSPIAAQWEPLSHKVMENTVQEYRKGMQTWNGIKWMPTDSWDDGTFFGQMIGKGIGWEMEYCRQHKEWERLNEIFEMLRIVQYKHPIYMENAYLMNGKAIDIHHVTKTKLKELEQGVWKIVDAGNGEQVSWWCWSMARLRKEMGLSPVPEKVTHKTTIASEKKANGLLYQYSSKADTATIISGFDTNFNANVVPLLSDDFRLHWNGYIQIKEEDNYRFFSYSANPSKIVINHELQYESTTNIQPVSNDKTIYLKAGFYPIELTYDQVFPDEQLEVYFQKGIAPKREPLPANMLYFSIPGKNISTPPIISPLLPEIEEGKNIEVAIKNNHEKAKIFYTIDGTDPNDDSKHYTGKFTINNPTTVKAVSIVKGKKKSPVSYITYKQVPKKILYELKYPPHSKYTSRGIKTLFNDIEGTANSVDEKWLGFEGTDFDLTVNFQNIKEISSISVNFLHNQNAWIFAPEMVSFYISIDGKNYTKIMEEEFNTKVNRSHLEPTIKTYKRTFAPSKAQFIRIVGKNIKYVPNWHPGRGKAWIFVDEINIQ